MSIRDDGLLQAADEFADDIADLLVSTVADSAPISTKTAGDRVSVAAYNDERDRTVIPLTVGGTPRFDLRVDYWCTWDATGSWLAVDESQVAVALHGLGEPIVRFHYRRRRPWAESHVHVHAESGALGLGLASRDLGRKPPKTQILHVPTGARRFRPCLEDIVEFLVHDLGVDTKSGWQSRVDEGRQRWHDRQLSSALRHAVRHGPPGTANRLKTEIDALAHDQSGP